VVLVLAGGADCADVPDGAVAAGACCVVDVDGCRVVVDGLVHENAKAREPGAFRCLAQL
jgi:hypothetical protein